MKVVVPITLALNRSSTTIPYLVSSTIAEPASGETEITAFGPWNFSVGSEGVLVDPATGAPLQYLHRKYRCLTAQVGSCVFPGETNWETIWVDIGATNRWGMFDNGPSTVTRAITNGDTITVVFKPGVADTLVFIGLVGDTFSVLIKASTGGATIYSSGTLSITAGKTYLLTGLATSSTAEVTVTINRAGAKAECAMCVMGNVSTVGATQYGAAAGIRDYSKKVVDPNTGAVTLTQGKFAKTLRALVRADATTYNTLSALLESLRATPVVWIGDNDVREGLAFRLEQMRSGGQFVTPWIERPFLWLLNYTEADSTVVIAGEAGQPGPPGPTGATGPSGGGGGDEGSSEGGQQRPGEASTCHVAGPAHEGGGGGGEWVRPSGPLLHISSMDKNASREL